MTVRSETEISSEKMVETTTPGEIAVTRAVDKIGLLEEEE